MKWLLIFALGLFGCGDDPPPTVSGGGERVPTGISGGAGATGGAGGAAGAGGAGGAAPKGACDNGTDLDALEGASVRNVARDCGLFVCTASVGNSIAYGQCVDDCVLSRVPGITTDCANCYGNLERCGLVALCRFQCQANTCSLLCLNCLNDASCITEFEECRGLPGDSCV